MANIDLLVLNTVNASFRRLIDAETLAEQLVLGDHPLLWPEHVRAFFEEVPREAQFRFVLAHTLSPQRLLVTWRAMFQPEERTNDPLEQWLSELAATS